MSDCTIPTNEINIIMVTIIADTERILGSSGESFLDMRDSPKLSIKNKSDVAGSTNNMTLGASLASPHGSVKYSGTKLGSRELRIAIDPTIKTISSNATK